MVTILWFSRYDGPPVQWSGNFMSEGEERRQVFCTLWDEIDGKVRGKGVRWLPRWWSSKPPFSLTKGKEFHGEAR